MTPLEVNKSSTFTIMFNMQSLCKWKKQKNLFLSLLYAKELQKDAQESGYQWARNQKEQLHDKDRKKLLFNSFIDFLHFEAYEYVTYSKYNKKRKTEIAYQFYI